MKGKIIVILGPTSSGKSDIAIKLAEKFNGEIISADSRQVYRGLDIGTGKVPGRWIADKRAYVSKGILHHMIDIVSPRTDFNAAQFKKKADKIMADILRRGKLPIICGGSGFWIKAVVNNVIYPEVKPDLQLRKQLSKKTKKELFAELLQLDPARAKAIDKNNPVRLIRAIEICETLGKVPKPSRKYSPYNFLQIGINLPKEKLHANIRQRLEKRFEAGMIQEVENLHGGDLSWKKIGSFGLGYFLIPKYLRGAIKSEQELFEKIYLAEKDYAKRQMTWFKKDKRIIWLDNFDDMEKKVKIFLKD